MHRACMVVHATYPDDTRVRREAEALLDAGWQVDVVCLRGEGEQPFEEFNHAAVYRLPVRRHRGSGLVVYMLEYLLFCLLASIRIMRLQLRCGYDLVQIHNMPDFLVVTALVPRLWGARVLLDMHDLVPELYASRFAAGSSHLAVQIACLAERASVAFADHVITAGEPFRRRLIARGIPADKVTVIMNGADSRLFRLASGARPKHDEQHFTLIYHGSLFERYGLDIALEAVKRLRGQIPGLRLLIYGEGEAYAMLAQMVADLDLSAHVRLCGFAPVDTIPALIALADLEIVPYRRNAFTDMLYPSKAFECLALGVPVIMARTGAVAELFAGVEDMLFRPEDPDALAAHVLALYRDPERLQALLAASQAAYAPYAWDNQRADYVALVARMVAPHGLISQANR